MCTNIGGAGGGAGGSISNVPTNAVMLTDSDADALRKQQDSMYDPNTTAAIKMYISDTNFDGQGHSLSQTMNYLLDNDVDLYNADYKALNKQYGLNLDPGKLASMQYADSMMTAAMHEIGKSIQLQRGAHDDILRDVFGISDYTTMNGTQLKNALVGKTFRTKSHMSTSYDVGKNPFLNPSSPVAGGREVVYNINAGPKTKMLFGAKKQSEVVLGKDADFRIVDVRYTGRTATPRGGRSKPQIEIDIETF